MPPVPPSTTTTPGTSPPPPFLRDYPDVMSNRLKLTLLPLDITTTHLLLKASLSESVEPLLNAGSPLAEWVMAFLAPTLERSKESGLEGLSLHDPLAVWYAITSATNASAEAGNKWKLDEDQDVRVETAGQWTRGACVVDRRGRQKIKRYAKELAEGKEGPAVPVSGDAGGWLDVDRGNRVRVVVKSPGESGDKDFEAELLRRIFAL